MDAFGFYAKESLAYALRLLSKGKLPKASSKRIADSATNMGTQYLVHPFCPLLAVLLKFNFVSMYFDDFGAVYHVPFLHYFAVNDS
jgi:hypothetical protein